MFIYCWQTLHMNSDIKLFTHLHRKYIKPQAPNQHHCLKHLFLDILTFVETYRPHNLNTYITIYAKLYLSIENISFLRLDRVFEKRPLYERRKKLGKNYNCSIENPYSTGNTINQVEKTLWNEGLIFAI